MKKKTLACCIVGGVLASFGCQAAPADTKAIKVGIILTYSGPDASIGEAIDRGAELFLRLHGSDLPPGVELQLIKRDETGPTPDVAQRLARELIVREGVQILTGGQWTPNVSAIAPLVTEAGIPVRSHVERHGKHDAVVAIHGAGRLHDLATQLPHGKMGRDEWPHTRVHNCQRLRSGSGCGGGVRTGLHRRWRDNRQFGPCAAANGRLRAIPGARSARQPSGPVRVQPRGAGSHTIHQGVRRSWVGCGGHTADRTECDRPRRRVEEHGRCGGRRDLGVALFGVWRSGRQPYVRQRMETGIRAGEPPQLFRRRRLGWHGGHRPRDSRSERRARGRADSGTPGELEQSRQPARADADRSGDPRRHSQHLHPAGRERGRRTAEHRVRDDPVGERSLEGAQSGGGR